MSDEETTKPSQGHEAAKRMTQGLGRWVKYSAVGMQFVGVIVACIGLGWAVDRWVGTAKPWFSLMGALLGIGGGMWRLIAEFGRRLD